MPMTRTTISFSHDELNLLRDAAKRQGKSVSQFVREAAVIRARLVSNEHPFPVRELAERMRTFAAEGQKIADAALKVAEDEADRRR